MPPYLQQDAFDDHASARASRIDVRHVNLIDHLRAQPPASLDGYVLLDAQDWMTDADPHRAVARDHPHGPAGRARDLPHRRRAHRCCPAACRTRSSAAGATTASAAARFTARDRSAIYGGFHLYTLRPLH